MKVLGAIKMKIPAGKATPAPPVGPMLGQYGLNLMEFCKDFNNRTSEFKDGILIPVHVIVYDNKSFDVSIRLPEVSYFLNKLVENTILPPNMGKHISIRQVYEIAKIKKQDAHLENLSMKSMCKMIMGTAKSMGITIVY